MLSDRLNFHRVASLLKEIYGLLTEFLKMTRKRNFYLFPKALNL